MCTALSFRATGHYFGRNLDLEREYPISVAVTPRNWPLQLRNGDTIPTHHAMIGMAAVESGYPLYFEATNETGLSIAGLNFPKSCVYHTYHPNKTNITPFELIPWLLGQFKTVRDAALALEGINLWNEPYSEQYPLSTLHWLISDEKESVVLESMADGLHIYENPTEVLTNEPPFPFQLHRLSDYMSLSPVAPENRFAPDLPLQVYSLGMGGLGLPGDLSSSSRFVREVFHSQNAHRPGSRYQSICQFFHLLGAVAQPLGSNHVRGEEYEFTMYTSCCDTERGIYYYTTYYSSRITAVDMQRTDLTGDQVVSYPLVTDDQILMIGDPE